MIARCECGASLDADERCLAPVMCEVCDERPADQRVALTFGAATADVCDACAEGGIYEGVCDPLPPRAPIDRY